MPKFFCEYCGIYLTHSSPHGRKQHVKGKKHIANKIEYFSQFLLNFQRQLQNSKLCCDFKGQMMGMGMAPLAQAVRENPMSLPSGPGGMGQMPFGVPPPPPGPEPDSELLPI
eukprot:TRINITY_DN968_c0_g2_i8.p1 TRINITY_DN968_c0_g2~~TRINITY_DN968_c0_g2_i8.p1  ORF type:complete len:112 (-),score=9.82 TRINITY_DN968_c0_g2_i8:148-483(-)